MVGKAVVGLLALGLGGLALVAGSGTASAKSGAPGGGAGGGGGQPVTPPVQNPNAPDPSVLEIIQRAKDTANPAVLLNTADMLDKMGMPAQAQDLRALAAEISAVTGVPVVNAPPPGSVTSPTQPQPPATPPAINLPPIAPPPGLPGGATPAPIIITPMVITATPDDPGKQLAANMTAMLQGVSRRGQENKQLVGAFQQQEIGKGTYTPLAIEFLDKKPNVADQLYGAASAVLVSSYGIVPVRPFYWSSDPAKAKKQKALFTTLMLEKAATDPSRANEWMAASNVANS
jgi:hypothetical protein